MGDQEHGPVPDPTAPTRSRAAEPAAGALATGADVAVPARAATALAGGRGATGTDRHGARRLPPQVLLRLQRTHGNAAVCRVVGGPAAAAVAADPVPVQRCGGEVHEGCSCADAAAPPTVEPGPAAAGGPAGAEAATDANEPAVQRNGPDPTTPVDRLAIPADSPYATTPAALMNVFKESYRNNTMLFAHGPDETLVQVLDRIGVSAVSVASEIYQRMALRGIWPYVRDITWVWLTTSRGLTFNTTGGLRAAVNSSSSFCKEFVVASMAYHGTTEMWREFVTTGTPGLHIGAGEEPASVHIDMHQVAVPLRVSPVPFVPGVDTGYCDYDPVALVGHWGDLQGNDSTVFSRAEGVRGRLGAEAGRIDAARQSAPAHASDLDALSARLARARDRLNAILPRLRMLATAGMEGEQQATAQYDAEIRAIDAEMTSIGQAITGVITPPAPPPPSGPSDGGSGADGGVGADDEE